MGDAPIASVFQKTEGEAQQQCLQLLLKNDHVPIDLAHKATFKITKEYYPYEIFNLECLGAWSALSIWEHEEEYQVERTETVYIDYQGKEHKTPGTDTDVAHGTIVHRARKPYSRTVYDAKTRTVIDQTQPTSGRYGPAQYTQLVELSRMPSVNWANHYASNQFVKASNSIFQGCIVVPDTVSDSTALKKAKDLSFKAFAGDVQQDIPGNRFENLSIDAFDVLNYNRRIAYLGVYHIVYTYEGKSYDCFISGSSCETDYQMIDVPTDKRIKAHNDLLDDNIKKTGILSSKSLFFVGAIISLFMAFLASMATMQYPGLLPSSLVIAIWCIVRFAIKQKQSSSFRQRRDDYRSNNQKIKQRILEISSNDSFSPRQKQQAIEKLVASHSGGTSSRHEQLSNEVGRWNMLEKAANIIALVSLIAVVVFSYVSDALAPY